MITITEICPPRKLSGLSSFLITFPYNETVVEKIKTLPNWCYHKKDYAWEVPGYQLAQTIDLLTFLDDIQLNLLPEQKDSPEGLKTSKLSESYFIEAKSNIDWLPDFLGHPN